MLMNKEKFLKTEFGAELDCCIKAWDHYLTLRAQDVSNRETAKSLAMCQAQWEVYKLALKQFYSLDCHFTRTREYYGIVVSCESDSEEFLIKYYYPKNNSEKWYKVFAKNPNCVCGPFTNEYKAHFENESPDRDLFLFMTATQYKERYGVEVESQL
jgi:hypothetical protein